MSMMFTCVKFERTIMMRNSGSKVCMDIGIKSYAKGFDWISISSSVQKKIVFLWSLLMVGIVV